MVIRALFDIELLRATLPSLGVVPVRHVARYMEAVAVGGDFASLRVWHPMASLVDGEELGGCREDVR